MIIFHEGLPRSGKSYEATKEHIVPALKKGRKVFARINGLNYEKIAQLAEITEERCRELLHHIPEEQVHTIYQHIENDSLVIIDELQNFFPSGRQKLSDDMTKFITEHGHRGLDIVTMGQSITDCHNTWRRRTQRKIQFLKLDMVGMENRYKWTAFQGSLNAKGDITFTEINSGTKKYDPEYFGAYLSHQPDTTNKDNLEDARLNLFNQKSLRYGLPIALAVGVYAIYHLFSFFQTAPVKVPASEVEQQQTVTGHTNKTPVDKETLPVLPADFVAANNIKYRPRLTYMAGWHNYIQDFLVVWEDPSGRVMDQLYMRDFEAAGYKFDVKGNGIEVKKGETTYWYRWMPNQESYARVPNEVQQDLAN
ncbi:zonular occludens toxin family protein [Alishewanella longhuensis]